MRHAGGCRHERLQHPPELASTQNDSAKLQALVILVHAPIGNAVALWRRQNSHPGPRSSFTASDTASDFPIVTEIEVASATPRIGACIGGHAIRTAFAMLGTAMAGFAEK